MRTVADRRYFLNKCFGYSENVKNTGLNVGVGVNKTFGDLGFTNGELWMAPDGWYIPKDKNKVMILMKYDFMNPLELKDKVLIGEKFNERIEDYLRIAYLNGYKNILGIVFYGDTLGVKVVKATENGNYLGVVPMNNEEELQTKEYYTKLFNLDKTEEKGTKTLDKMIKEVSDNLSGRLRIENKYYRCAFIISMLLCLDTYGKDKYNIIRLCTDTNKGMKSVLKNAEPYRVRYDRLKVIYDVFNGMQEDIINNFNNLGEIGDVDVTPIITMVKDIRHKSNRLNLSEDDIFLKLLDRLGILIKGQ